MFSFLEIHFFNLFYLIFVRCLISDSCDSVKSRENNQNNVRLTFLFSPYFSVLLALLPITAQTFSKTMPHAGSCAKSLKKQKNNNNVTAGGNCHNNDNILSILALKSEVLEHDYPSTSPHKMTFSNSNNGTREKNIGISFAKKTGVTVKTTCVVDQHG